MTDYYTAVLYEQCQADDYVPHSEPISYMLTTTCNYCAESDDCCRVATWLSSIRPHDR